MSAPNEPEGRFSLGSLFDSILELYAEAKVRERQKEQKEHEAKRELELLRLHVADLERQLAEAETGAKHWHDWGCAKLKEHAATLKSLGVKPRKRWETGGSSADFCMAQQEVAAKKL